MSARRLLLSVIIAACPLAPSVPLSPITKPMVHAAPMARVAALLTAPWPPAVSLAAKKEQSVLVVSASPSKMPASLTTDALQCPPICVNVVSFLKWTSTNAPWQSVINAARSRSNHLRASAGVKQVKTRMDAPLPPAAYLAPVTFPWWIQQFVHVGQA